MSSIPVWVWIVGGVVLIAIVLPLKLRILKKLMGGKKDQESKDDF